MQSVLSSHTSDITGPGHTVTRTLIELLDIRTLTTFPHLNSAFSFVYQISWREAEIRANDRYNMEGGGRRRRKEGTTF